MWTLRIEERRRWKMACPCTAGSLLALLSHPLSALAVAVKGHESFPQNIKRQEVYPEIGEGGRSTF